MATYKLIQDIEAEDKILGPLTLRQFIFALIAAFFLYLSYFVLVKGAAVLLALFLPPALFCGFFAFPFGKDQPTEIWFLAKLRFWFVPRKRVWDQSGVKELVTITVPKKIEKVLTNGLSQTEVKSRLQALANTIDSRGWVIKNVSTYSSQPAVVTVGSDRLIELSSMPQEVPADDTTAADDILDTYSNPVAQQFDSMINQSTQAHHQDIVNRLNAPPVVSPVQQPPSNKWFMGTSAAALGTPMVAPAQAVPSMPASRPVIAAPPTAPTVASALETADEVALAKKIKQQASSRHVAYEHLRTVQPLGSQTTPPPPPPVSTSTTVTAPSDPAILALANNDDLNVATLAREAHKARGNDDLSHNEVVVSLR